MSERTSLPMLVEPHLAFDALADLLSLAEVEALASRALALAIDDFGARACSLFYDRRPPLRLRHGDLVQIHHTTIDHWEKNVQKRISSGSWTVAPGQESLLASRPVPGTDDLALYGLVLDEREVRGTICLIYPQDRAPGGRTLAALSGYLRFVANAVRMAVQLALTTERLGQLSLFYQVAQSMASTLDVSTVLENSMQLATAVLDASVSALMLVDEEKKELVFEYAYGPMSSVLRKQRTGFNEGIAGWVANHGIPVVVNDARTDPRFSPAVDARTGFLTQSVVCAPIQIRGKTLGVLEALNKRGEQGFDSEDLRLMVTTANQAAVSIENARLYESLRQERDRIIEAQENVRRQVARNLHDGTVQFLSAIAMGVDHLERLVEFKPEDAKSELASLRRLTRQASQQARLALFELRPVILETQGLLPALGSYAEQLRGNELFAIHLEAPESLPEIRGPVAASIFAVVQEAVNNVKKHACARDVWLRLSADNGELRVVVEDNGSGFDLEAVKRHYDQRGSIGLLNMRERAELIEGQLEIRSEIEPPNRGTRALLRVPLFDQ